MHPGDGILNSTYSKKLFRDYLAHILTHSKLQAHSDASAADDFKNHCDKNMKLVIISNFSFCHNDFNYHSIILLSCLLIFYFLPRYV